MSTVVFLSAPAHGHINPTLSLVAELVRRGERVFYYALEEFQTEIEGTGATFRSYGRGFPTDPIRNNAIVRENPFLIIDIVLQSSEWVLTHLLEEMKELEPDYIMHDVFCCWGNHVAQILHVPAVASSATIAFNRKITAGGPSELFGLLGMLWSGRKQFQHSRRLMKELHDIYHIKVPRILFEVIRNYSTLNIVYTSSVFQPYIESFDERFFKFVGPSPLPPADASSFPFDSLGKQPLMYISLGTVYNDRASFFRTCIEAFAESEYQVVMAVGNRVKLESLGTIPSNFIVQNYVPQQKVLEHCSLFITHGGMNSVSDALYQAVPMIVVPQSVDQPWNARRVVELGAGKMLSNQQVSVSSLRQAVNEVVSHPDYAQAAARIGESLRQAGGCQRAADEIEAFKQENKIA